MKLKPIPLTGVNVLCDLSTGDIYYKGSVVKGPIVDMSPYWCEEDKEIPVDVLVAIAYFDISIPYELYKFVKVYYSDKNPSNRSIENMYYNFGDGLECKQFPGYYYIPYFTSYIISKEGAVLFVKNGTPLNQYSPVPKNVKDVDIYNYYVKVYLRCDYRISRFSGRKSRDRTLTLGRYRLMAFAFLTPDTSPFELDVNHINGIRDDDRIENLEWCTRQRNCEHAYSNGLRSDNQPVVCKDYKTNTITRHYSISSAGRYIGVDDESVRYKLTKDPDNLCKSRYVFRYADDLDSNPFPTHEEVYSALGVVKEITAYDIFSNEETVALGSVELAKILSKKSGRLIKEGSISFALKNNRKTGQFTRPYRGYMFKYEYQKDWVFPVFSDFEKEYWKRNIETNSQASGYGIVVFKDGKYHEMIASAQQASKRLGIGLDKLKATIFIKDGVYYFEKDGSKYELFRLYQNMVGFEKSKMTKLYFNLQSES